MSRSSAWDLPNDNKRYVHDGITECVILWNTMDLGYLTVHAARALYDGKLKAGATEPDRGPPGIGRDQGGQYLARPAVSFYER